MPAADTKDRILDAAEKLFANHGYDATSVRAIATAAGVNLAAINYHFQSKDALLHAVYARRAGPVNARRLELLDEFEAAAGGRPLTPELILEAFLQPIAELGDRVGHIPRMMVRLQYVEQGPTFEKVFETHFRPMFMRFFQALKRALPGLGEDELFWRLQFTVGAFAHIMASGFALKMRGRKKAGAEQLQRQLIAYASAGFRAEPVEREQ
ncbi:MAG: TetR family transcriptional regulator [Bryobacteraceae bacterium]|nr:TetR family transcriptional regulator [Bryobacteraceae bacterium]